MDRDVEAIRRRIDHGEREAAAVARIARLAGWAALALVLCEAGKVLLAGAVLTETIFSWPGIGKWLIDSIARRDYPVVQAGILISALTFIGVNLLVDVLYGVVNPRIRGGGH